jgi:hypothetical protein
MPIVILRAEQTKFLGLFEEDFNSPNAKSE